MRLERTIHNGEHKPSLKQAISNKLRVLQEFCVFYEDDVEAKDKYERKLLDAVARFPNRDYEIVLDQVGTQIVMDSF